MSCYITPVNTTFREIKIFKKYPSSYFLPDCNGEHRKFLKLKLLTNFKHRQCSEVSASVAMVYLGSMKSAHGT